jgi:hypothetical protein
MLHHLAADGQNFVGGYRPGKKSYVLAIVESGLFAGAAEHENGHGGQARGELRYERRAADAGTIESHHYKPKFLSEKGFFHQYEGFRRVGSALDIMEMPFEDRSANIRLQRVVVDQ